MSDVQLEQEQRQTVPAKRADARVIALATALGVSFAFCYADVFRILWTQWNTNEANSHGLLIPWIAAYLLWLERQRLQAIAPRPVLWAGVPLLLGSLGVLLVGRLMGIAGMQEVSMVGTLWAVALLCLGWAGLRAVWFPVGYLLFMMPIWDLATEHMYYPLQLFAARGAELLLSIVRIPVFRDGTVLQLPNVTLEVALACSGINFLMSVFAIGVVLASVMPARPSRRLLVVLAALIISLLANPVRVALIAYSFHTLLASPQQAHMWQGMAVSLGAFLLLFASVGWLADPRAAEGEAREQSPSPAPMSGARRSVVALSVGCCLLLLGVGTVRPLAWQARGIAPDRLRHLPAQLGEWRAVQERPTALEGQRVERDEFWREYRNQAGESVRVYVGRFAHEGGGPGSVVYWSEFVQDVAGASLDVERIGRVTAATATTNRSRPGAPALYWYQIGRRTTTSRMIAKLHSAWCAVSGVGEETLVVAFLGPATVEGRERAVARNQEVAERLAPFLIGRVP